jgi:predicted 3-demethylubiquinone-9 3-methyltransferase (glyoxalase superfamily)
MNPMQKITPFLWFDNDAEEAMRFYASIFKDAKTGNISRYPDGRVMTAAFQLNGQDFMALNGGPLYKFNEAISLFVDCQTQAEVDELWEKLTADGGQPGRCGWLKDKFGLWWQIVPAGLGRLLSNPKAMEAMLKMSKLDIHVLEASAV